jgi:thiol-disulfide isomerase/thioredoxin
MVTAPCLFLALMLAPSCAEGPFQDLSVEPALVAAKRDNKIVMIDFFTTWCGPCKKLDATTWKDPEVLKWLGEKTVALRIDAEKEKELAAKHRIKAYPTMLFLKPDGSEMDRIVGYKGPKEFLSQANDALAGKNALTRAKEKLVGYEENPMARGNYADVLADAGRYEEALQEYLWCFDNGKKSLGYGGVRLSFLLGDIARLGKDYPPAIKALEERRDAAETRLGVGSDSPDDAAEAVAINRELDASKRNLELYDRLRGSKPLAQNLRAIFGRAILEPLVDAQRYEEIVDLFDNPEGYVTGHIKLLKTMPKLNGGEDEAIKKAQEEAGRYMMEKTVHDCARMYEALLGADRRTVAAKVADHLIEFCPTGYTYSTLVLSATRARANDVARTIGERGLNALPEAEKAKLQVAMATIPTPK